MRATIGIALIAALAAAAPATADDRAFSKTRASVLTEGYVGQPLWSLLASCAGAHGAAHAYYAQRSKAAKAEESKAAGSQYLDLAVARLVSDRGLDRDAALQLTLPVVEAGRSNGVSALAYPGKHEGLKWLALKTSCQEIAAGA
jgi:hypothetical protein